MSQKPRPNPTCPVCRKPILPGVGRIRRGLTSTHAECEKTSRPGPGHLGRSRAGLRDRARNRPQRGGRQSTCSTTHLTRHAANKVQLLAGRITEVGEDYLILGRQWSSACSTSHQ
jgi:hypothetical protein